MIDTVAAQRYARALFEISREAGRDQWVEDELEAFSAALKGSEELQSFLESPKVSAEEKRKLLEKISPASGDAVAQVLNKFFALLLKKNRFTLIHEIAVAFKRISDEAQNEAMAEIKTAVPLTGDLERQMVSRLEKMTGAKIAVKKEVDPRLIGGVSVRMNNKILDGSIYSKIQSLKRQLVSARTI